MTLIKLTADWLWLLFSLVVIIGWWLSPHAAFSSYSALFRFTVKKIIMKLNCVFYKILLFLKALCSICGGIFISGQYSRYSFCFLLPFMKGGFGDTKLWQPFSYVLNFWPHYPEIFFLVFLIYLCVAGNPRYISVYLNIGFWFSFGWALFLFIMLVGPGITTKFLFGEYLIISNCYTLAVKGIFLILFGLYMFMIDRSKLLEEDPARYLLALILLLFIIVFSLFFIQAHNLFLFYMLMEGIGFVTVMMFMTNFSPNAYSGSAMSYYNLSLMSTAFVLLSLLFIQARIGAYDFSAIFLFLEKNTEVAKSPAGLAIMTCFTFSLFFKFGVYPLSLWLAPIYKKSSYDLILLYGVVLKAIFFCTAFPAFTFAFAQFAPIWGYLCVIWGTASIVVGAVGAFEQFDVKEFSAHTSVNHFGHIVIMLGIHTEMSFAVAFAYLFVYILASFGFLGIFMFAYYDQGPDKYNIDLRDNQGPHERATGGGKNLGYPEYQRGLWRLQIFSEFGALRRQQPHVAAALTVFLLTFAGVPPAFGFFVKYTFYIAVFMVNPGLAAALLVFQVCSLYYYLAPVAMMWFGSEHEVVPRKYPIKVYSSQPDVTAYCCWLLAIVLVYPAMHHSPLLSLCSLLATWGSISLPSEVVLWNDYSIMYTEPYTTSIELIRPESTFCIYLLITLFGTMIFAYLGFCSQEQRIFEMPKQKVVVNLDDKAERFHE